MVHDNFQGPTGMGLMCQGLAEAVLDAGWALTIVGTDVPPHLAARAEVHHVRRRDRLPALPQHIAWCAGAAQALRHVDADVVHVHSPFLLPAADLLTAHFIARPAHARGIRADSSGLGGLLRRVQGTLTRWLDSAAYTWGAGRRPISFVRESLRDESRSHYGEPIGGWILSPPAPPWQPVSEAERAAAKRRWGCDGPGLVAGYL